LQTGRCASWRPRGLLRELWAVGVQVATTLRPTDSKEISCFLRGACLVISGGEWHGPVVDDAFHHDG
jgi:hypothetical protein